MKKLMSMAFAGVALVALNGCGSSGGDDNAPVEPIGPITFGAVDVLDLPQGYIIDGYNEAGEDVTLEFCNDDYDYYSGPDHWYGEFFIIDDRINMLDETPTGGSYRIDTDNYKLEVGEKYYIDFQNDEIIVEQITEDLSC